MNKTNAAAGKVRLNYLVDAAAWHPQYKVRAGKGAKDPVQVEYLAAITQQSGEDWQGVELVLSTAEPMLNATPPELRMLAVKVVPRTAVAANKPAGLPTFPGQGMGMMGMGGVATNGLGFQGGLRFPNAGQVGQVGQLGQLGPNPYLNAPNQAAVANTFEVPKSIDAPVSNTVRELDDAIKNYRSLAQQENNLRNDGTSNELWNLASSLEQARDLVVATDRKKSAAAHVASSTRDPA